MLGKILSLGSTAILLLALSSCGTTSYSDFDSSPDNWQSPGAQVGKGPGSGQEIKKRDAEYFAERAIEFGDLFERPERF